MRTIRFRAKAAVNNKHAEIKVGDWVFGSFIESGCDAPCIIFGDGEQIEIDRLTLGQLILDKNDWDGAELWEDDIVESDYYLPNFKCVSVIKFVTVDNDFKFGFDNGEQDAFRYGNLTVIGNKHDKPELLKGDRS